MLRKITVVSLALFVILSGAAFAKPIKSGEIFEFTNVYEYDENYDKIETFDSLVISLDTVGKFDLNLRSKQKEYTISDGTFQKQENKQYKTISVLGTGKVESGSEINIQFVYDKKENANGTLILVEQETTTDSDGSQKTISRERTVRFANDEAINLKELVKGIKSSKDNTSSQTQSPSGPVVASGQIGTLAAGDLPVVKSYKYSNYMYGGVFWNTDKIIQCSCNNMQIKMVPLYGGFSTYTDPYGRKGTLIYDQTFILSTNANYNFTQNSSNTNALGFTTVNVDNPASPKYLPIKVAYKGLSVTFNIPLGSDATRTNGYTANWNISRQNLAIQDGNGNTLDNYYLDGVTSISGVGKGVSVSTSVNVKIGAMYYFGTIPAQQVALYDTVSIPTFNTTVSN